MILSRFGVDLFVEKTGIYIIGAGFLVSYISPIMLLYAVCLLIIFARMNIKQKNITSFLGKSSFGIYLIGTNTYVLNELFIDKFVEDVGKSWWQIVIKLIVMAVSIFMGALVIEKIRQTLFDLLHISRVIENFVSKIRDKKEV